MGTLEDVAVMLRSVLQSTPEGVRLDRVESDYRTLTGDFIPYRRLRYPNLEALLRDMPGVVRIIKNNRGETMVQAISDSSTQHIASLVARQRVSRPKARGKGTYRQPPNRFDSRSSPRPHNGNYSRGRFSNTSRLYSSHSSNSSCWPRVPPPQKSYMSSAPPSPPPPSPPPAVTQLRSKSSYEVPPRFLKSKQMMQAQEQSPSPSPPLSPPVERRVQKRPMTCRQLLEEYAARQGIGPLKFTTIKIKHSKDYTSKVSIENSSSQHNFSTYPAEFPTEKEAEEAACREAVERLGVKPDKKLIRKVSQDLNLMFLRIREIVESYRNGVMYYQVPVVYLDKYEEELPNGWLTVVKQHEILRCQQETNGVTILYPLDGSSKNESETSSNSDSTSSSADLCDCPSPRLVLPDEEWAVYVSHVSSAAKISFRFVGPEYSEKYDELTSAMETFYDDVENMQRTEVMVGNIYALKEDSWFRVEVTAISDGKAEVYFVDHGGLEEFELSQLFVLNPKFMTLPFQAVGCILHGLEDFEEDTSANGTVYKMVAGKTLIADPVSRDDPFSVILYDTSTADDINFNQLIDIEIMAEIEETSGLSEVGSICEGYLRHVSPSGDVYIQPNCRASRFLNQLLTEAATMCEGHLVTSCEGGKMYLAKCLDSGSWQRAVAIGPEVDGEVNIDFIDSGKCDIVPITNLRELDCAKRLTRLPSQCYKCKLSSVPANNNLEWSPDAVNKLVQMAPEDLLLILKMVNAGSANENHVELFKRLQPSQELVSINSTLALNTDLFRKKEPVFIPERAAVCNNKVRFETLSLKIPKVIDKGLGCQGDGIDQIAISRPLDSPILPDVGDYFDVHVTMAASPSNFVCQPWMSTVDLERLTEAMQEYYNNPRNLQRLMPYNIIEGNLYACKHVDDGLWYRVQVKGSDRAVTVVSIYYIDFGDTAVATSNELQVLPLGFQDLAYQAIFCKLAYTVPLNDDWRPEDCVRFQSLVVKKEFVAVVINKSKDNSGTQTIELDLIDTEDPVLDISVSQKLIDENRARFYSST